MARKVRRVPYMLDSKDVRDLSMEEIRAILRGADDLIAQGGRNMLAKILRGSRDQAVLKHHGDDNPVYGYYRHLTLEQILARVDWVILSGYLRIEYVYRLPVLIYTDLGWEIERETYAEELLHGFDALLSAGPGPYDMLYLKDRSRDMILLLLDKVQMTGDPKYIPLLRDWEQVDYKKVQQRIRGVIRALEAATR